MRCWVSADVIICKQCIVPTVLSNSCSILAGRPSLRARAQMKHLDVSVDPQCGSP